MSVNRIFRPLPTVTLLFTLLIIGGCKNMETKTNENVESENAAIENIMSRKSVRAYTAKPVEKEKVEILLKAAMAAPTAVNKQPWAFIVIDDRTVLDNLARKLPYAKMTAQAQLAIVVCGDLSKALNGEQDKYWMLDCSAASENLLLAAESLGLGAVWTAVYPEEDRMESVREVLSLPEYIVPLNLIPIGYPQHTESAKDKYKPENIHYNKW
ncbi:nitroreductase family protein [Phocaeicola sp.]